MTIKHKATSKILHEVLTRDIQSFKQLENKIESLVKHNTTLEGDAFEVFIQGYIATNPKFQTKKIWVVKSIPEQIRKKLNLPSDAKGIDGVFENRNGEIVPYQVKFRKGRPKLTYTELAPFLGVTERAKSRIIFTNCNDLAIDIKNRDSLTTIRGIDLDEITQLDIKNIYNWLDNKKLTKESYQIRPYQEQAVNDIINELNINSRTNAVMACGSGKTLVGLWVAEKLLAKTILLLVPSLTLLQQTLEEWLKHNPWGKNFIYTCICSDNSVADEAGENDSLEYTLSDLSFPVHTDSTELRRFLRYKFNGVKVIFSTYQSSKVVADATKGIAKLDFAIFDEAHKTTGRDNTSFSYCLHENNIKIKKRLFLTATPKHYNIAKRDRHGEISVVSMDDNIIYGKRAHTLTFGKAVSEGIICKYKVIISVIEGNQINNKVLKKSHTNIELHNINSSWVASQLALTKAIRKTKSTKVITFHSRVSSAKAYASQSPKGLGQHINNYEIFHVNGKQNSCERKILINDFRNSKNGIITNARCLTEGIDVPAVDMVAFIDPRHSKIDIAQATGRAMRIPKGSTKDTGYIVIPIFLEKGNNESLEKALKRSDFKSISNILNAMQEQDEELVDIISQIKEEMGQEEVFNSRRLKDKIEIIGNLLDLPILRSHILTEIVQNLGSPWDEWFGLLKQWRTKTKKDIPEINTVFKNKKLGIWVGGQRSHYKKGLLSQPRIDKLNSLSGWSWDLIDKQWDDGIFHLKKYYVKYNTSRVPDKYLTKEGFKLGSWCKTKRLAYNRGQLSNERASILAQFTDWSWNILEDEWNKNYENLSLRLRKVTIKEIERARSNKNTKTKEFENDLILSNWISLQKRNYRAQHNFGNDKKNTYRNLQDYQIRSLEKLNGWSWDRKDDRWQKYYELVTEFVRLKGIKALKATTIYKKTNIGRWITKQRTKEKEHNLTQKQAQALKKIKGLELDVFSKKWDELFKIVNDFVSKSGSANIAQKTVYKNKRIGSWISTQRQNYKSNKLDESKRKKLETLKGWKWDSSDQSASSRSKFLSKNKILR